MACLETDIEVARQGPKRFELHKALLTVSPPPVNNGDYAHRPCAGNFLSWTEEHPHAVRHR